MAVFWRTLRQATRFVGATNRIKLPKTAMESGQRFFGSYDDIRVDERFCVMLHNILLIVLGLVLTGVLTAIFETQELKNHPYVARIPAAVCIVVGA
jgi:hypothetical protein